ncbi:unnamed protein product, partial [Ixodes hexagonus]
RCHSAVLRSEIVEHCKNGCSVRPAGPGGDTGHPTLGYDQIEKTSNELKEALEKLSEDLSCLHTSLNQCREDVRGSEKRFREQLEAQSETHFEHFTRLSAAGSLAADNRLSAVADDIGNAVKVHIAGELRAEFQRLLNATKGACPKEPGVCGPKEFHWYFEGWAALKEEAMQKGVAVAKGPLEYACGYRVSTMIVLRRYGKNFYFTPGMRIYPGTNDSRLQWPLRKAFKIWVFHDTDEAKSYFGRVDPCKGGDNPAFHRQKRKPSEIVTCLMPCLLADLEAYGFLEHDMLHLILQVEP